MMRQMKKSDRHEELFEALIEMDQPAHLGRLVRGLIHNINGPLQNISMLLELLERTQSKMEDHFQAVPPEHRDVLMGWCMSQRSRIERLLDQVHLFSEMLRDFMVLHEIQVNESEIDVNLILEKLGRVYKADLFFKHHVVFECRLAPRVPLLRVLAKHLIPALQHLMENALLAVRKTPEKRIVLSSELHGDQVRITLEDSGCGLPEEVSTERLFEPLVSAWSEEIRAEDPHRSHRGLGLTIARALLKPYGALLSLQPLPGGTQARIVVPVPGSSCRT